MGSPVQELVIGRVGHEVSGRGEKAGWGALVSGGRVVMVLHLDPVGMQVRCELQGRVCLHHDPGTASTNGGNKPGTRLC